MKYRVIISGEERETYSSSPIMAAWWAVVEMNFHGSTIAEVYEYDKPDDCLGVFDVTHDYYGLLPVLKGKPNPEVRPVTFQ